MNCTRQPKHRKLICHYLATESHKGNCFTKIPNYQKRKVLTDVILLCLTETLVILLLDSFCSESFLKRALQSFSLIQRAIALNSAANVKYMISDFPRDFDLSAIVLKSLKPN